MLIKIHSSLVANLNDRADWQTETITSLEFLALARKEGKHIVIADRETLNVIIKDSPLDNSTKEIYKKIRDKTAAYMPSYLSAVSRYIEVVGSCPEPKILKSSGKEVIQVAPSFFNDSETIQKTILLGENSNDSRFYETITRVYLIWKKSTSKDAKLTIAQESRGGGGSTLAREYKNIQQSNKRLCLCIVDSDRLAPESSLGLTAKTIEKENNSNCTRTQLFILDVREIENLIPTSILTEVSSSKDREKALNALKTLDCSPVKEIRSFLDLKKGILLQDITKIQDDGVKRFWSDKISNNSNISIECQENWSCHNTKSCICRISLGFGNKILEDVIDWLEKTTPHKIAQTIATSDPLRLQWERLGQTVINWCLAESPIRA